MKRLKKLLLRLFWGGGGPLRDYEQACLDALRLRLDAPAVSVLDDQLRCYDLKQRWYHDKTLKFGLLDKSERRLVPPFPNRRDALYWARVTLKPTRGRTVKADIITNSGYLVAIEFSRRPKETLSDGFSVTDVQVLADIMEPQTPEAEQNAVAAGEVSALFPGLPVHDVKPGLAETQIGALTERWGASIPDEIADLLVRSRGCVVGSWVFHGEAAWRIQADGDNNLWAVAEAADESRALCLAEGDASGQVFRYDLLENQLQRERRGFLQALREEASRSTTDGDD